VSRSAIAPATLSAIQNNKAGDTMKTKKILYTLALACLGAGSAHATPLPLQNASITATYNGAASGMLGVDHLFDAVAGSNITTLDPIEGGLEFVTGDYFFGIDFSANGALTVYANNEEIPSGAYSMRFDFGSSLANPINAFTMVGSDGASGVPGLSIINDHTIELNLGNIRWTGFGSLTTRIETEAPRAVPEPATPAIMLVGVAGLALARRPRKPHA
jgi:hypothetical protein